MSSGPTDRRRFLRALGGVSVGALGPAGGIGHSQARPDFDLRAGRKRAGLPSPRDSGIEHVVVVTMENRSFDHLLGWLPGADGQQAGLSYTDGNGEAHPTNRLTTFVGCSH